MLSQIKTVATGVAVSYHEPPNVVLRRRIVVAVTLVVGAVALEFSLTRSPGSESFYWATLALAGVWSGGAVLSRPIHLGAIAWRGRNQRPVITGSVIGLLLGGVFLLGGLVAREIASVNSYITRVLEYADRGSLLLVLVIAVLNGAAEECFFRGAVYSALGRCLPVIISTALYIAVTAAAGNPMLSFAAVVVGAVCALERRATGGVLAPVLTHVLWSLFMVLALPKVFGL